MWTSARAAIGVVAKGMNVHTTLGVRIIASDVVLDSGRRGLGLLREGHGALDIGVTTENCDCSFCQPHIRAIICVPGVTENEVITRLPREYCRDWMEIRQLYDHHSTRSVDGTWLRRLFQGSARDQSTLCDPVRSSIETPNMQSHLAVNLLKPAHPSIGGFHWVFEGKRKAE